MSNALLSGREATGRADATTVPETPELCRATKRSLVVLSHAMERSLDVALEGSDAAPRSLFIATFQRHQYFAIERERIAMMAAQGTLCIVAFAGPVDDLPPGVHGASLPEDEPLTRLWSLGAFADGLGVWLEAHDLDDLASAAANVEAGRLFDARWSFDPRFAASEAVRYLDALSPWLAPDVIERARGLVEALHQREPSTTERRLAAVSDVLVRNIDVAFARAERMELQARHQQDQAERDALTGLYNRRFLDRYLLGVTAETPVTLAALLIDLDELKFINDTYGHAAGTAAIVRMAHVLRAETRPQDVVIRYGGDEFLVLLPGLSAAAGAAVGQAIIDRFASSRLAGSWATAKLSASGGVTASRIGSFDLVPLDAALYRAKGAGKGRIEIA